MDPKSGPSIPLECVSLAEALFCAECEMISNSKTYCFCCGSSAVIPVARVLGGSLRPHHRATVVNPQALLGYAVPDASEGSVAQRHGPTPSYGGNGKVAA